METVHHYSRPSDPPASADPTIAAYIPNNKGESYPFPAHHDVYGIGSLLWRDCGNAQAHLYGSEGELKSSK